LVLTANTVERGSRQGSTGVGSGTEPAEVAGSAGDDDRNGLSARAKINLAFDHVIEVCSFGG
jgi:hypothetical protein